MTTITATKQQAANKTVLIQHQPHTLHNGDTFKYSYQCCDTHVKQTVSATIHYYTRLTASFPGQPG